MNEEPSTNTTGIITEDPAVNMPIGSNLHFNPALITHEFESQAVWLKDWDSFQGVLLSIHFRIKETHSIEGSAVLVAPGIALSAKHVFTDSLDDIMNGKKSTISTAITKDGLQIWRINKITLIDNSDLVILGLTYCSQLPSGNLFNMATITTRFPKIGENLLITGFRASDYSFEIKDNDKGDKVMNCSGNVLACNGIVSNRFPTGRDKVMLPWPTLEVDCPSFGGMSGGPVFDSNGLLIGLLSSSFDDGPSYVSLLWQSLAIEFEGGWPNSIFKNKSTLIDLSPTLCAIDRSSAISVTLNKDKTKNINYEAWEE